MEDSEVDFIINEFLRNLGSGENEILPAKSRRIHHVHWWDGWENKPEDEPKDLKVLKFELIAILERTGANKKVVMEELRKRTREDKTGESVKCLVLAYYKMNSFILGSDLKDTNNFASKVYKMLQLEYFEERGKFSVEEGERADEKSVMKENKGEWERFTIEEDENGNKEFHLEEGESKMEGEEKSLNAHTNGMQDVPHYVANEGPLISLPNIESLNKITTTIQIETEEDLCLETEDLKSAGIIELKEARESQELKVAHDPNACGMLENKDFDDLLLQIAAVEAEWNALNAVFSMQECKGTYNKFFVEIDEKSIVKEDEASIVKKDKANIQNGLIPTDLGDSRGSHRRRQLIDTYVYDLGNSIPLINMFAYSIDGRAPTTFIFFTRCSTRNGIGRLHKNDANYVSCRLHYREDIYNSDVTWRRLIRSVLEQGLATLRSSLGLVLF